MEEELVRRLKSKNQYAWKELYSTYSGYLTFVGKRYISDTEVLRDILQNSFIKMFNGIEQFEFKGSGSLKAWISKIVVNESLKYIKQNAKITFASFPDEYTEEEQQEDEPDVYSIPQETIMEVIQTLPDGYRLVFNLYVFENKTHKEIAKILNISENTSASQYHRAKKMIAQKLMFYNQKRLAVL